MESLRGSLTFRFSYDNLDLRSYGHFLQEGRGINRKNLNENLETPHLAPAIFSHLPGFYLKTGIINPSPFLVFVHPIETMSYKFKVCHLSNTHK